MKTKMTKAERLEQVLKMCTEVSNRCQTPTSVKIVLKGESKPDKNGILKPKQINSDFHLTNTYQEKRWIQAKAFKIVETREGVNNNLVLWIEEYPVTEESAKRIEKTFRKHRNGQNKKYDRKVNRGKFKITQTEMPVVNVEKKELQEETKISVKPIKERKRYPIIINYADITPEIITGEKANLEKIKEIFVLGTFAIQKCLHEFVSQDEVFVNNLFPVLENNNVISYKTVNMFTETTNDARITPLLFAETGYLEKKGIKRHMEFKTVEGATFTMNDAKRIYNYLSKKKSLSRINKIERTLKVETKKEIWELTREQIAERFCTTVEMMDKAEKIKNENPELFEKIKAGKATFESEIPIKIPEEFKSLMLRYHNNIIKEIIMLKMEVQDLKTDNGELNSKINELNTTILNKLDKAIGDFSVAINNANNISEGAFTIIKGMKEFVITRTNGTNVIKNDQ